MRGLRRRGEAAAPAARGGGWGKPLGCLGLVGLVGVAALAALTTAGSQTDRLLEEVGGTLSTVSAGGMPAPSARYAGPAPGMPPPPPEAADREGYDRIDENAFKQVTEHPLSTFAIDVDTASYANVRRKLNEGSLPPKDAVRLEELVNYFTYADPPPTDGAPFSTRIELAPCPWAPKHRLARIGIKGRTIPKDQLKPANLVFLLDVSGSMMGRDRLGLLKKGLAMLTRNLQDRDRVAIVVYAGASGLVLPSTSCANRPRILEALEKLQAGGSTNAGAGIELAYAIAREHFLPGGVNRVLLATDGDFNVGVTSRGDLTRLVEEKAKSGVFLTVLGFGRGNLQDSQMEALARRGNGNYAYIDSLGEARRALVEELGGTLVTIAKDVKIQVEFNPAEVASYRLLGYENRVMAAEDFNDDTKDAGEIGAGHSLTALYELVPPGVEQGAPAGVDPLKYQSQPAPSEAAAASGEAMTVKLRYKEPDEHASKLLTFPVPAEVTPLAEASTDLRFSAAVAEFAMLLRDSEHVGEGSWAQVLELAKGARGEDPQGYRGEFVRLVGVAQGLAPGR